MRACSKLVSRLLLTIAVVLPAIRVQAADPVAVVSVSGVGEAMSDIEYLLEATGTDGFGAFILPQVKTYLQGLNRSKPLGMVLSLEGGAPQPLAFIPVNDLDTFLSHLEDQVGEPADAGGGVLELQGPQPIFVKEQGGWAFIGQTVESLDNLPANPQAMLNGMEKKYDVAIRGFIQNIPPQYRDMIKQQMRSGFEQGLEDTDDPQARKMAEAQIEQFEKMFAEGEEMTFGWNVNPKQKRTFFEFTITAKPGTELATQMANAANAKTKYSGFLSENAAISGNFSGVVPEEQIEQTIGMFQNFKQSALKEINEDDDIDDENVREGLNRLVTGLFEILEDTARTGTLDSASSVVLNDKSITIASASHVADGTRVEEFVRELVEIAEQSDDVSFSKREFNSGTHNGITLHELAIPIPDDEYVSEVLGGELEICLGTAENDVFAVVGANPVATLKRMVDASRARGPVTAEPFNATIKLSPILKFAETVDDNVEVGGIVEMLDRTDNDHIRIKAATIENGLAYRFTIEEGVLKAIGQAVQMQMAEGF